MAEHSFVIDLEPAQLRELVTDGQRGYLLVDVREPEEHQAGHLPGAVNIPLRQLEAKLPALPERESGLIFYCRTGRRSRIAAELAARCPGVEVVYNLLGGLGQRDELPELPSLRGWREPDTPAEALWQLLDMEKGTDRLYRTFLRHFDGTPVAPLIRSLIDEENAHSLALYEQWARLVTEPVPPFEELQAELSGELIESGESYDEVAQRARRAATTGAADFLELALELEHQAQDFYRSLADSTAEEESRLLYRELAAEEKSHVATISRGLACLAAA